MCYALDRIELNLYLVYPFNFYFSFHSFKKKRAKIAVSTLLALSW